MYEQQARLLIETGAIKSIVIYITLDDEIEIWLDGNVPPNTGNTLVATRGHTRQPATIDAAVKTIRKLGWKQQITIDGGK